MPAGVILETEGNIQKIQKKALYHYKTVKKSTPNLTSPYVYGFFTIVLIKQIFEKIKQLRAGSGNWTQFKLEVNPGLRVTLLTNRLIQILQNQSLT